MAGLILITLTAFWGVMDLEFVNFDDHLYVQDNPHLQLGLSLDGLRWAFTSPEYYNWIPVTLVTYLVDYEVGGTGARTFHVTNLLVHTANVLLLYWVLRRLTRTQWPCAFAAALFAVHPLHVESVAWVAERKDVVSAFFWFLTMLAYLRWRERACPRRYILVCLAFAAGLMAKPMLVTLPCVLILLDYWPLQRLSAAGGTGRALPRQGWQLLREKVPLFVLAAGFCVVTWLLQGHAGPTDAIADYPLRVRIANACLAYAAYIGKALWPARLAVFYPHPGDALPLPMMRVAGTVALVLGLTLAAISVRRRHPYMLVGWLWYIGALIPVIGLIQVGEQGMADRYTYIPLVGLSIALAWGLQALVARWRPGRSLVAVAVAVLLAAWIGLTWRQVGYWQDSVTLWQHTLAVTSNNTRAHYNLGCALLDEERYADARAQFGHALRLNPRHAKATNNIGAVLMAEDRFGEAVNLFEAALEIQPDLPEAHVNLGHARLRQGKPEAAIGCLAQALRLDPENVDAHIEMAHALTKLGQTAEANQYFAKALRLRPGDADVHYRLGSILLNHGQPAEAVARLAEAARLDPNHVKARVDLGVALGAQQRYDEAVTHLNHALELEPDNVDALYNLGAAFVAQGRTDEARRQFTKLLAIRPDDEAAKQALSALSRQTERQE